MIRKILSAALVTLLCGCSIFGDDPPPPSDTEKAVALSGHESCTPYLTHLLFIRLLIGDTGCSGRLIDSLIDKPVDCKASVAEKCAKNPESDACVAKTMPLTVRSCEIANCEFWEINLLCKPQNQ